ncbi:MAG: MFS transporter, partial [Proteobacteria bacterium]|nr:MFS transporter [Pseudomonadota bacterium]
IGGAILFLAVAWTVFSSREYTNEELDNFSRADEADAKAKAATNTNTNTASSTTAKAATATDEVASATAMESAAINTASSTTAKAATNATDVLSSTATKATTVTDEVASTTAKAATATDEVASATAMESVATDTASSTTAKAATNTNTASSATAKAATNTNTASSATAKAATTTDVLSSATTTAEQMRQHPFLRYAAVSFVSGLALAAVFYYYELKQELYILAFGACAFSVLLAVSHALQTSGRRNSGLFEMMDALFMMPLTMRRLAVTQFFAWFALFAMWIYTTSTVARQHYNASPDDSALYNEAGNLVGQLFATYNGVAALAALTIPLLSIYLGRKLVFALFLMCGALGLLSFLWVEEASQLYISMCGIGLMWAAVLSIPYAMLSSALPHRRMGLYMGVFNFFIVLPQILAASILGFLISTFFDSDPVYALMLGGLALFVAAASLYLVPDPRGERGKLFN